MMNSLLLTNVEQFVVDLRWFVVDCLLLTYVEQFVVDLR